MRSGSKDQPARERLQIELWSWSAWLVLCIISYPAVVLIWTAPVAGLVGGLAAGLLVLFAASSGYARRGELDKWHRPALLACCAALVVAGVAFAVDGVSIATAALCGSGLAMVIVFIWHFLPWLVHDAQSVETVPAGRVRLLSRRRGPTALRGALGLVLLLALLMLGLGASWARGERQVPNPAAWAVGLAVLTLTLMFIERMSFFERSAREGNLLMPAGSYRKWIGVGLIMFALAGALAAAVPWRPAPERTDAERTGSAGVETWAPSLLERTGAQEAAARASAVVRQLTVAAASVPRGILGLWLLLLLLLIALVVVWGFRRSRAARWLLRAAAWCLAVAARALGRLRAMLSRVLSRRSKKVPPGAKGQDRAGSDPLFDPFDHPQTLAALSPRELVIRTYHLLLNFAEMLGHGRRRGQTPFEFAEVLQDAAPGARESVIELTWAYAGAMYGGDLAALPESGAVHESWQRISGALTGGMTPEDLALRRRAYLAARLLDGRE